MCFKLNFVILTLPKTLRITQFLNQWGWPLLWLRLRLNFHPFQGSSALTGPFPPANVGQEEAREGPPKTLTLQTSRELPGLQGGWELLSGLGPTLNTALHTHDPSPHKPARWVTAPRLYQGARLAARGNACSPMTQKSPSP